MDPHGRGSGNDKECSMKARMYRLTTTVALLAVVVEVLGAGAKWC